MKYISKNQIYLIIITFLINLRLCLNEYLALLLQANIKEEFEIIHFKNDFDKDICQELIPSLFSPILLAHHEIEIDKPRIYEPIEINLPPISIEDFRIDIYNYSFLNKYHVLLGQERFSSFLTYCYLALSFNFTDRLNESSSFLNKLKENNQITKKVFSFDKWILNKDQFEIN